VTIFGDYDVDGATSAALLVRLLRGLGLDPGAYIPDRLMEGYGPSGDALVEIAEAGSSWSSPSIAARRRSRRSPRPPPRGRGDRRRSPPMRDDAARAPLRWSTPTGSTKARRRRARQSRRGRRRLPARRGAAPHAARARLVRRSAEPSLIDLLDLVALGTVADVARLTGLNRAFVTQGLKVMARRRNVPASRR
jgi:single-stranded-DNA-specific exonuclease